MSVEEIIRLAEVSKPTFYRHFQDKYDLACRYNDHLHEPVLNKYNDDRDFRARFKAGSRLIMEYKDVYASLFENPFSQNSFYQYFVEASIRTIEQHIDKTSYTDEMKLELYRCMHGNIYVAWQIISGNLDMDFDKSMDHLVDIMPDFIRLILQIK